MPNIRRSAAKIHLWLGLTIGLAGMYLAATGAWILFRPQADAALSPSYLRIGAPCEAPLSLDRILASAARTYPRSPVDSIDWDQDPHASLMVRFQDEQQLYFNPCTGALLGQHSRWSGPFAFVEKLHRFRFMPISIAEPMAGAIAAVMALVMGGLGLFLWWPRRLSAWKPSLKFDPALHGRARTRNRHSVVGAFAAIGLLIVSGTGVFLAYDSVSELLFTATGTKPIAKPDAPFLLPGQPVAMQAAWRNALDALPAEPRAASLRLPTPKRSTIEMYIYDSGNPNVEGRTYIYADARDGRIIEYVPYADTPLGQRLHSWFVALHEGEVGGPLGQLLTFATMLAILYLGYTGVKGYIQKRAAAAPPLRLRVDAVHDVAPDVKVLSLVATDGRRLPRGSAGAHVEVRLPGGLRRQYSLCNGPGDRDAYTLAVRLAAESRGGSSGMHGLNPGQELLVSRPRNHFPIVRGTRHATLIAAGIGVTPMLSMARHLAKRGRPFVLHYFGRDKASLALREEMIAEFGERLRIHAGLGRAAIPSTLASLLANRPSGGHVYTCGPDAFMSAVEDAARAAGWPDSAIHRENFAPPGLTADRAPFEVVLARSGRNLTVGSDQTLLQALACAGVSTASSCEQGTCGECALHVRAGSIDHRDCYLSDSDRARGDVILACVSRAREGELVLDC